MRQWDPSRTGTLSKFISVVDSDSHERLGSLFRRNTRSGVWRTIVSPPESAYNCVSLSQLASSTYTHAAAMTAMDAIIIGAGWAGAVAARHLAHSGKNVLVLEARGRIGGRARTHTEDTHVPIDLGCSFIHGTSVFPSENFYPEKCI